ncbi:Putative metabolite transport protein YjhB [Paraburkholderia hiiakae]|uniref:Metabolite transport protein YjhB n=1 Tax=Paraburkholderia hiiakae TaxID=1081782 RepID=A0ABN7HS15_9BURK|nr:MFS transporter [Paraburkholderia hiiakae]CAD6533827.1 Putative metabolite transport protein YjhB [Paraburkholderia hiiakae]
MTINGAVEAVHSPAEATAVPTSRFLRYSTLGGAWGAWLFDAVDAAIFSFVILSVSHTFSASLSSVVSTAAWFLLATGIGGFLLGNLSDRVGRKTTLLISVLTYATGTLLCGFARDVPELGLCRFVVGIGVGGLWSAAVALVGEVWPASGRARAMALMQTGWSGGSLLAAIFAWTLLDPSDPGSWRRLFIVAAIPAYAVALVIFAFVKESPVWLANRHFLRANANRSGLLQIFQPGLLKTTLLALSVSILGMYGYWIIMTFTPAYLQSVLNVRIDQAPVFLVWTGVGATAGYLLFGVLAERIGRRRAFALFFGGIAVAIPLFACGARAIPLHDGKLAWTAANITMLGGLSALLGFFTGYFSGFGAWYAELFPTSLRSTAAGFCFNFGRVGAIAGIKLVPALAPVIGFTQTYCLASLTYICAAILVFALKETRGAELTSGN